MDGHPNEGVGIIFSVLALSPMPYRLVERPPMGALRRCLLGMMQKGVLNEATNWA